MSVSSENRSAAKSAVFSVRVGNPEFPSKFLDVKHVYEKQLGVSLSRGQVLEFLVNEKLRQSW